MDSEPEMEPVWEQGADEDQQPGQSKSATKRKMENNVVKRSAKCGTPKVPYRRANARKPAQKAGQKGKKGLKLRAVKKKRAGKNKPKPSDKGNRAKHAIKCEFATEEEEFKGTEDHAEKTATEGINFSALQADAQNSNTSMLEGLMVSERHQKVIDEVRNKVQKLHQNFVNPDYEAEHGIRTETISSREKGADDTTFLTGNVERIIESSGTRVVSTIEFGVDKANENISKTIVRTVSFYGHASQNVVLENVITEEEQVTNGPIEESIDANCPSVPNVPNLSMQDGVPSNNMAFLPTAQDKSLETGTKKAGGGGFYDVSCMIM